MRRRYSGRPNNLSKKRNSKISDYEKEKKVVFRFPKRLRFPLAWTLIFLIIGIIVQSYLAGRFIFIEFFWENLLGFFYLIVEFAYSSTEEIAAERLKEILFQSYYFFYVGGLISIIWSLVASIIYGELKKKKFSRNEINQMKKIRDEAKEGSRKLKAGKLEEAKGIYENIRRKYSESIDENRRAQNIVVNFYNDIIDNYNKKISDWKNISGKDDNFKKEFIKKRLFQINELVHRGNTIEAKKLFNHVADYYESLKYHDESLYKRISDEHDRLSKK